MDRFVIKLEQNSLQAPLDLETKKISFCYAVALAFDKT